MRSYSIVYINYNQLLLRQEFLEQVSASIIKKIAKKLYSVLHLEKEWKNIQKWYTTIINASLYTHNISTCNILILHCCGPLILFQVSFPFFNSWEPHSPITHFPAHLSLPKYFWHTSSKSSFFTAKTRSRWVCQISYDRPYRNKSTPFMYSAIGWSICWRIDSFDSKRFWSSSKWVLVDIHSAVWSKTSIVTREFGSNFKNKRY